MVKGVLGSTPKSGIAGYIQNWRADLFAAISVSLVALPLGLGIAIAAEAPPMAGIIPAIIGGLVTTFIRSSHVAINGPGASLIVVILAANQIMEWPQVLAAIVMAGVIQTVLGLLRLGRFGEAFPASVVQGMVAAIGLIIIAKQAHVALGVRTDEYSAIKPFIEIVENIPQLDPKVTFISIVCLGIMIFYPWVKNKFIHFIPPPIWVLFFAIPLVLFFDRTPNAALSALGMETGFGSEFLISIPDDLMQSFIFQDFSRIDSLPFWGTVAAVTIIASI